jgi:hypothetical protein
MPKRERISPDQIQALRRLDLREIAERYTTLRGGREKYGPCPRCGGVDRFHVQQHMFQCRQCYEAAAGRGRHDIFEFAQFIGLATGFREAYEVVCGWANTLPSPVRPVSSAPESRMTYESTEWQKYAQQEAERCHTLLMSEQGTLGQAYLRRRGLTPAAWLAARLGLMPRLDSEGHKGWAISIPWTYENMLTAIQYRFLDPRTQQRYTRYQHGGCYGETVLFTMPSKGGSTLVVCEGEFNAISVWQATSSAYDAISVGSQSMTQKTLEALRRHAAGYEHIKVWTDEPSTAVGLIKALGGGERVIADGDANELLQQGRLEQVLA